MSTLQEEVKELVEWFEREKKKGLIQLHCSFGSQEQLAEQFNDMAEGRKPKPISVDFEGWVREMNILNRAIANKEFIDRPGVTCDI